jgi:hypothetical protein
MSILKTIIQNTVGYHVGTEPTKDEIADALAYIIGNLDGNDTFGDIDASLYAWRDDSLKHCTHCGQRHLPTTMICDDNLDWFCSHECKSEYKLNQMSDDELRTY